MTSFLWWANQMPTGHFMCCLCFEEKSVDEASTDEDGVKWDKCLKCHEWELEALRRREQRKAS